MSKHWQRLFFSFLLVACFTGCATTRPHQINIEDGSLHAMLRATSVTVLKDGQLGGAGAFVDGQGTILTAAHVVNPPDRSYAIVMPDGSVVPAKVTARDLGHDLAILKPTVSVMTRHLGLADAMPPAGASIFVVAAPSFYADTLLPGRIARDRPGFNHLGGLDSYVESYIIAADTPKGASGGCWVNAAGQIVGVQSAFLGDDRGSLGIAFIGPVAAARALLAANADIIASTLDAELVDLRSQAPGFIGRFPRDAAGCAVHRIKEGGALDKAGVPRESLITHIHGTPVRNLDQTLAHIRRYPPGTTINLRVVLPDSHSARDFAVELGAVTW